MDNITVVVIFITAVAVALALTLWFESVTMARVFMTHAEILEYHGHYITYAANGTPIIHAILYNRGTEPVRIVKVYVNNMPAAVTPRVLEPGAKTTISILCPRLRPGNSVKVEVFTASGTEAVFIAKA